MTEPRRRSSGSAAPASSAATAAKKPTRARRRSAGEITAALIAERAYEISLSEACGSPEENWLRAEQELLQRTAA
ncbi:MAG TPA: hypothetical protein VGF46_07140 [Gaiellales bacterium]|jgi:hypothetical protein